MSTQHPITEKLNLLGAAMITATAAHALFCLATLPGLLNAPTAGFIATALKFAGVAWNLAGVAAAGYAAVQSAAVFNGRSLASARKAVVATLILPLVGLTGGVTAFALLPIGAVAFFLLRSADWQSAFADHAVIEAAEEPIELNYLHEMPEDLAA